MKCLGSKARIAADLIRVMNYARKKDQIFYDVFAGGMNLVQFVRGHRHANSENAYTSEMFKALLDGRKFPEHITRERYSIARRIYREAQKGNAELNPEDLAVLGWIGWVASCAGRFYAGGYSGHNVGGDHRDYIAEQIRAVKEQTPLLKGVSFSNLHYTNLVFDPQSLIYCDPLGAVQDPNFWKWCRTKAEEGHTVFVSAFSAPTDFTLVWEDPKPRKKSTDKLYTLI